MGIEYGPAIDMIISDPAWVFTDALKGLTGGELTIVLHKTACGGACDAVSVASFFAHDTSERKSVHFIVGTDGTVVQVVHLKDGAGGNCCLETGHDPYWDTFQARYGNLNECSISIEHVDPTNDNSQTMTEQQINASFALVSWLVQKFSIPISHIKGHNTLDPQSRARCPGPTYPMSDLLNHLQGGQPVTKRWFDYDIIVPFGDTNFDVGLGGSHDLTVAAPANTPVTALLPGKVVDVSSPSWGKQIGIQLDSPYNGIPYMAYLHLSATNVNNGQHVNKGDVIGWVGGANDASQYSGTSNPTGQNFLNTSFMSSQVQIGIALIRGPVYGTGAGWAWSQGQSPDMSLDPTPLILDARKEEMTTDFKREAFNQEWTSIVSGISGTSGIANAAYQTYWTGNFAGPATSKEFQLVGQDGKTYVAQTVLMGIWLWDGAAHYHPYKAG